MTITHSAFWPTSGESLSVLVVDDNHDAGDSLAELLRLFGHGVQVVYDADDALLPEMPDVVILELRLPRVSGWELVRRMREREAAKSPLFVAVTTCGSKDDRRRSEEAGIDLHLVKPVDPAVLVGVLNRFARVFGRICCVYYSTLPATDAFGTSRLASA